LPFLGKVAVRIAYVTETYPPELNGVALTVERTVRHLRRHGHSLELIRPRQAAEAPLDAPDELRTLGCPIPMYPDLRLGLAAGGTLRRRFARTRPQLVHVATEGPLGWAALQAAQALRIPVSSDFRTNFHQYSRYYGFGWLSPVIHDYLRRFHNRTQRTFVPTHALRDELAATGFRRLDVVGRGVDTTLFGPGKRSAALREQWGAGDGSVLLYVGRLAAEKNVELALCGCTPPRHGWWWSATARSGAACRPSFRARTSPACSAGRRSRSTMLRPTCSSSPACRRPSAT
jgi:glycosyltransferase involved in cell wall biosynthesis